MTSTSIAASDFLLADQGPRTQALYAAINRVQAVIGFSLDGRDLQTRDNFLRTFEKVVMYVTQQIHREQAIPEKAPEISAALALSSQEEAPDGTALLERSREATRQIQKVLSRIARAVGNSCAAMTGIHKASAQQAQAKHSAAHLLSELHGAADRG